MSPDEAIRRMREVIRRQYKALSTEETYVQWLRRYMAALTHMPAGLSSEQKLERFLTSLAKRENVAASTQNQAFNAILYFYKEVLGQPLKEVNALRATRPAHLRHAPTVHIGVGTASFHSPLGQEGRGFLEGMIANGPRLSNLHGGWP